MSAEAVEIARIIHYFLNKKRELIKLPPNIKAANTLRVGCLSNPLGPCSFFFLYNFFSGSLWPLPFYGYSIAYYSLYVNTKRQISTHFRSIAQSDRFLIMCFDDSPEHNFIPIVNRVFTNTKGYENGSIKIKKRLSERRAGVTISSYRNSYRMKDCRRRSSLNQAYPVLCGALHRCAHCETGYKIISR